MSVAPSISIATLLPPINRRLRTDFRYEINLEGLEEYREHLSELMDLDVDSLMSAAKGTMLWKIHLVDSISVLDVAIGQYQNVLDIYTYLDSVAIKDPDEFALNAPKYKIDSRDLPLAIKIVQAKTDETAKFVKALKMLRAELDACADYMLAKHFKCVALVIGSERRMSNASM